MSTNIRFPNITGVSEAEQLTQIKSYLYQLVEQLNWMLPTIEASAGQASTSSKDPAFGDVSAETFYELKSLLIKSSDTLNAYYEKINAKLEGQYVKQADFNGYKQEVSQSFNDLVGQYVAQDTFDGYKQEIAQSFADLGNQYVSQTGFDAYKQEVTQQFDDLGDQYVSQSAFDAFKQENAATIADLDSKFVSKVDYDAFKQEVSQDIADLQQSVDDLQQIINAMQETGG